MGKVHSKGLHVCGERERTKLFVGPQEKERNIQGWKLFIPWLGLDHRNSKHRKKLLGRISTT